MSSILRRKRSTLQAPGRRMRWPRRSSNWMSFSSPWAQAWDDHDVVDLAVHPITRGDPESPLRWTCKSSTVLATRAIERRGCGPRSLSGSREPPYLRLARRALRVAFPAFRLATVLGERLRLRDTAAASGIGL